MDKNLPALLREDTYTVHVKFWKDYASQPNKDFKLLDVTDQVNDLSNKAYTYVTDIPDITIGDHLIVLVAGIPKVVTVIRVDKTLDIQPNENVQYKWVVTRVDYTQYKKTEEENDKIIDVASKAYRKNTRKTFKDLFLSELDDESKLLLTNIGGSK